MSLAADLILSFTGANLACHPTHKPGDTSSEPGSDSDSVEDSGHTSPTDNPLAPYLDTTNAIAAAYLSEGPVVNDCGDKYVTNCMSYTVYAKNPDSFLANVNDAIASAELTNPSLANDAASLLCFQHTGTASSACDSTDTIVHYTSFSGSDTAEAMAWAGGFDLNAAIGAGVDKTLVSGLMTFIAYSLSDLPTSHMLMGGEDCVGLPTVPACE